MTNIAQALMIAFAFCNQQMPDEVVKEFAKELSLYPEASVLSALKRCRSELKSIKFSDILDRLPGQHPGVEEAWSQVMKIMNNEQISLVWTDAMREAYGAAAPLTDDPVAARMAFKEKYLSLVGAARAERVLPQWSVSLGFNPELRDEALREATERNLVSSEYAQRLLRHNEPLHPLVAQLVGSTVKQIGGPEERC